MLLFKTNTFFRTFFVLLKDTSLLFFRKKLSDQSHNCLQLEDLGMIIVKK